MLMMALPLAGILTAGATVPMPGADAPKRVSHDRRQTVAAAPSSRALAWIVRDRNNGPLGLCSFTLNSPENITSIAAIADKAYAGAMTPDGYYFYRFRDDTSAGTMYPLAWSKVDPATGAVTNIADWSDKAFIFNDMAYDWQTGDLYAIAREYYTDDFLSSLQFEYSALYKIAPTTGTATRVAQFIDWGSGAMNNPTYITLTTDLDGNFYVIDSAGYLISLDRNNDFAETVIGPTGRVPAQRLQTMDYDPVSGKIYWAADYQSALADLLMVDPATGAAQQVGLLGNDARLAGLAIPFDVPSEGAPAGVTSLTATQDAAGGNSVKISFTAPSKTFGGGNLASISSVTVERDGMPVNTWSSAAPGATLEFADNVEAAGNYTYTVSASNVLGKGMARSVTCWVGRVVPDAPSNGGIGREDDGSAVLVWDAPQTGLHSGWFDREGLRYKVVRQPGGVLVGTDIAATTFTDRTITSMNRYSYEVVAYTADGESPAARSVEIELGNQIATFPYNCLFDDQSSFDTWTVLNPNGGSTWKWKQRGLKDYDAFAMYEYDNKNQGDDYLVSPALRLMAGATYTLRFNYRGSNANYRETFDVRFGNEPTVEGLSQVLKEYVVQTGDGAFDTLEIPAVEADGPYYIAFHATSPKGQYNIYITDVTVTCTSGGDEPGPEPGELTAPTNLQASIDKDSGDVTLSWTFDGGQHGGDDPDQPGRSESIEEDWENCPNWEINPAGSVGWTYVDGDKGIPYRSDYADMPYPTDGKPLAAMIMVPFELTSDVYTPNPPHGGEKYLLFKSNFSDGDGNRPAPAPDDWLISPKLNFDSDFIFSFYCKADPDFEAADGGWGDRWNTEKFRVGYSLTGNDTADFIWLSDEPESVTNNGDEWRKKEYAIPAAAKYVCINYCTPENGFWFMVDDIYIGKPLLSAARAEEKENTFLRFDVYVDGEKKDETEATSYVVSGLEDGDHTARVVAVYEEGESAAAEVSFNLKRSGVGELEGDVLTAGPNPAADVVRFSMTVDSAELIDLNGRKIAEVTDTDAMRLDGIPAGIYLLRLRAADSLRTLRLVVR